jgi:hypothetical protein
MKGITIILLVFVLSIDSYCQKGIFKPFKLVIISPDTAVIDSSLNQYIVTVEQSHLRSYYNSIKQMEDMVAFKDYPDDMKQQFEKTQKQAKANLDSARKYENEVKKFRYYQTISEYSSSVLQFDFNEYPPYSTFQIIKSFPLILSNLKHLSDSLNADYIVGYRNISTINAKDNINLKLTTILYSKKADKLLLEKETYGDTISYGTMWTCMNSLSCLLINGVKTSTECVYKILFERHKK